MHLHAVRSTTMVVGEFDGMHVGHRRLLHEAVRGARRANAGLVGLVLESPAPDGDLLPAAQRVEGLLAAGCDAALSIRADGKQATCLAEEILRAIPASSAYFSCPPPGPRHPLRPDLRPHLARRGVEIVEVERAHSGDGSVVRSDDIRAAIAQGDVERAAQGLGRPFELRGPVVHGAQLGRTIGFPTANLHPTPGQLLPARGVYSALARLADGSVRRAAVNVGVRPTVSDGAACVLEAFLLDFDGDIYGEVLRLHFRRRLRDERRFPSLDALVAQLAIDVDCIRREGNDPQPAPHRRDDESTVHSCPTEPGEVTGAG